MCVSFKWQGLERPEVTLCGRQHVRTRLRANESVLFVFALVTPVRSNCRSCARVCALDSSNPYALQARGLSIIFLFFLGGVSSERSL